MRTVQPAMNVQAPHLLQYPQASTLLLDIPKLSLVLRKQYATHQALLTPHALLDKSSTLLPMHV